ncbi:MAG TPA: signal peptide peptidase SppA [Rhizomicrobium sp.]|jgi:protease-4
MLAFLRWLRAVSLGALNGIVKFALAILVVLVVLIVIGLVRGDGLPGNMVLSLDLRAPMRDSVGEDPLAFGATPPNVMDTILAIDRAGRDSRVKGIFVRVGTADMPVAQAEEIGAALKRFRGTGKFVVADATGFFANGLGDYLTAASANEIWMQPGSPFGASGAGAGAIFLRGLFDKINAVPQIVKRSDYKSAADMYMEKDRTPADREQTTAFLQSWVDSATSAAAADRHLDPKAVAAVFAASPQFADDARKAGLIDKIGYDDDARQAALTRAGDGAVAVSMRKYIRSTEEVAKGETGPIALIEASGEIIDGTVRQGGVVADTSVIAGDDLAAAIRQATKDENIKAIVLRVDSPGGSVTASDQILDAIRKAQAAGKPVVVSMGMLAASGGYYISTSANRIVAEPATLTGSIGVLTGKVAIGKSLNLLGVSADDIGVGKNALFDSALTPFTPDQLANLNHQADTIYADFTQKVAAGRKLPLAQVQQIAKGRVWTAADAKSRGLVDQLGNFWTAVDVAKQLGHIPAGEATTFKLYPRPVGFFDAVNGTFASTAAGVRMLQGMAAIREMPVARSLLRAVSEAPHGGVEMRATGLPSDE